ncbi:MAG TPA: CHAT domain-containing protein, partial [Thermoanaerobaculia bacterium]
VDDRSEWAGEARRNMETLTSQQPLIRDEMEGHYSQLEAGDVAVADAFAERDTGEVRRFFQHEVLGGWGDAVLGGRENDASRHLTAARTLADAVSRSTGDVSMQKTVAAIDSGQHERREQLARAHVAFRDGRRTFHDRKPAASEPLLASAAADFTRGGSPMAHDANVYRAGAVFGQNRLAEAEVMFRRLALEVPDDQPALRAYLDWQIASCHMTRADWGTSIDLLYGVITTLERLRETNNTAYVRDILSQVYDITGDRRRAWQHRIAALRELGKSVSYRLQHLISGLGYDASQRKDWRAATSFLQLEITLAHTVGDHELQTDALLRRALVRARLNDDDNAVRDLRAAKQVIDSVEDATLRERLRANELAAAALIASSPSSAVDLLSRAIQFHETKGWRMLVPDLYLRRGRVFRQLGSTDRAAEDFERGIAEIETHRDSLPAGELRWGVLDSAESLFEEAIDLWRAREPARALQYAERQRARALADAIAPGGLALDTSSLPPDVVVVEYSALPDKLVIFTADQRHLAAAEAPIPRSELISLIEALQTEASSGGKDHTQARAAYETLIAPVRERIASHRRLVFVPDATTAAIPFAVLVDPASGSRLLEQHTISVSPSAGAYIHTQSRVLAQRPRTLLMIDNPAAGSAPPLSFARAEADAIGANYVTTIRLSGSEATVDALVSSAPGADVIHFAGHGTTNSHSAALMLAATPESSGHLDAAAISRMRLPRSSLVVLAACGSARGPIRKAEGVLSVANAFLHAGVPNVVATLWPISDRDASDFFPRLHERLASGTSPADAVRETQLEFMRMRPGQTGLWASVQSIGR